MPVGSVVGFDCSAGNFVSLTGREASGVAEAVEGTAEGVAVGEGLHAGSRRIMVMHITRVFDALIPDDV